ncbi:MAG: GHKL domain-containing protein [Terrisporobacter othiniensis]|uniref:sensor histidine kinase n=1 Tax=Terrisporobacter petrolearius TaxID=1460447 RepID=UPI0022E6B968|nr:sensor histidine kinase [Terrisporobacter petrolearius]MDU4860087.1 GHKL domain-containing protein [Terrisporobacter othiniensis]MDU6994323.1 GHKL domain-containing protein [Terrisporobacter othiniensis]
MEINSYIDLIAYLILPIIGSVFIVYACFDFMKKVDRNIYRKKIGYIFAFVLFNIALSCSALSGSILVNMITFLSGILIIGHFLYNDSKLYLLYYCIFALCFLFVDLLVSFFISFVISYGGFHFSSLAYLQITVVFLIRIIEYVYIKLFTNFINRREAKIISKIQSFTFLVIPLFSVIYIMTLVYLLQLYAGFVESVLLVANVVLILILNIYVTHIFDTVSKNNTLQNEVKLYHQQSELQHKYYDNLENKYKESRKLIHDVRNHLQSIERLYENKEEDLAKKYTNDIHLMLNELNQKYYTSNRILNIILNDKYQIIKKTNIDFDCKIGEIDLGFIREIDITTIFANLLDNSIEAAKKVEDNSYIKFHVNKFNDFIVINIVNSMKEKPIMKNNKTKSTKINHDGLGLENIRKTLEKYEGNLVIDFNEDEFKVNIVIPN